MQNLELLKNWAEDISEFFVIDTFLSSIIRLKNILLNRDDRMKCIIYGLSTYRQQLELYLRENISIIGYSDSFSDYEYYNGKKFYRPNELLELEFDSIIISINRVVDCVKVEKELIKIGIESSKIIPLYKFIKYIYELKDNYNLIDKSFKNEENVIEGLVFGLSYGAVGIVPEYLDFNCYNFCLGSQDLYYTLSQLKYIKNNYREKICGLKYLILDMYTYTYFNYDVSMTKNAFDFIYYNGFEENIHNLNKNINYSDELINLVNLKLTPNEKEVFKNIFKTEYIIRRDKRYYFNQEEISNIIDQEEIYRYSIKPLGYSSIESNRYTNTENENINIFKEILRLITDISSDIKIFLVLIPRYEIKESKMKQIEQEWKERFYEIVEEAKIKYDFSILDFKEIKEISGIREYYSDLEHLNYNGAVEFTKMLSNYLKYI